MLFIENPLNTYIAWIKDRPVDWGDAMATDFFYSLEKTIETRALIEVSKEDYDAKEKAIKDYLNACVDGVEGLIEPDLTTDKYFEEDDDYVSGASLAKLIDYLNKFIELDEPRYINIVALNLFSQTDYQIYIYDLRSKFMDSNDRLRDNYVKNLLIGDLDRAALEEDYLEQGADLSRIYAEVKISWDNFVIDDFNTSIIFAYNMFRMIGG
ncbi:hypothetical protein ACVWYN_000646 [Pedobacter sp. UYP24]